jgi:hypothetical protein
VPKGHGAQAPSEEAFAPALAVPAGQGVQREGAEALKKVPEEHERPPPPELVQEVEPALSVKKSAGQATHVEEEVAELVVLKVLRGQGVGALEPAGQKEPAGQATFEQEVAPGAGEYEPAVQLVQDDWPVLGLYVPCAMARGCGGEWLRGKGAGLATAREAKGRPRAGMQNAPPCKDGTRR